MLGSMVYVATPFRGNGHGGSMNVDADGKLTFGVVARGNTLSMGLSTPVAVKTEKLEFAAGEIIVALRLAANAGDDFTARALARHVLVRARDFIALAYDLLGALRREALDVE